MKEFPPFRLDFVNQCLWRRGDGAGEQRIALTPKAFAMLRYLVEHAGRLVTQDELLEALWPDAFVQPEVLKSHISEIRGALGDDPKNARFIETLPRRGYQFVAPVQEDAAGAPLHLKPPAEQMVGRESALTRLEACLQNALNGQRQIVFIAGEPGIGKTRVVEEFLHRNKELRHLRVAWGQCVEGFGSKEPYYPILEALAQVCGSSAGHSFVQALATYAPTWLVQFPALVTRRQQETLHQEIMGATRERMLREISEVLEAITAKAPLLLVLEDLHWADAATVDFISALARRRLPSKFMLIGTYRPVDLAVLENPLRTVAPDLRVHQLCQEILLEPLQESDVAEYLKLQSGGVAAPEDLTGWIYTHTEGNPLFMVTALDHMRERGLITSDNGAWQIKVPLMEIGLDAPESLRRMIELQIERLAPEELEILEVASVLRKFSLAVAMGALVADREPDRVEELLEGMTRRHQIVRRAGLREYRNGPSACYEFVHVLYRQVVYSRIGRARRKRLHLLMAENGEALRLLRGVAMDTELAYQFEEGGDWSRAVKYLLSAADMAGRRFEPQQAADILEHALELVTRIPESERAQGEIEVLQKLCTVYSASFDPRALQTYEALVSRAAHYGLAEVEVHALLEMAFPLAFVHCDTYMAALNQALEAQSRAEAMDPLKQAAIRALYLCRRMGAGKWEPGDAQECRNVIARLRKEDDHRYLGELQLGFAFSLFNCSEYRQARQNAEEGFALFLQSYDKNPYLSWHFQLREHLLCSSLLFLGEWGVALRQVDQWSELAEKNSDLHSLAVARLERIKLQIQAMDFAGARQILESSLPTVESMPHIRRHWLLWAGSVEHGLGNLDRASEHLHMCEDDMQRYPVASDWYFRVPLHMANTEVWLSRGDVEKARVEAEQLLKVCLATEERTFRALALEANARVAMAEGELQKAQDCINQAVQAMEGYEVPLAHWRVHATACELYQRKKQRDAAKKHREFSRATIMKLANSLPVEGPLRQILLSSPAVSRILTDSTDDPRSRVKEA
jgi:DNA-binding winged helix-turn-helix (wHTH) protein